MMNDNSKNDLYPTKANMLKQLNSLIDFANKNKDSEVRLFLSYSGHGTNMEDTNGDEADGYDEALCPVDCDTNGFIVDDDIKAQFIDKLPENVKLMIFIDACHSGTICDLKYNYFANAVNKKMSETKCEVVMISGCTDKQTSADAFINDFKTKKNTYQGAMTASFLYNYQDGISYSTLIKNMRKWLKTKQYSQVPQLSSGKKIDADKKCLLSIY